MHATASQKIKYNSIMSVLSSLVRLGKVIFEHIGLCIYVQNSQYTAKQFIFSREKVTAGVRSIQQLVVQVYSSFTQFCFCMNALIFL